MYSLIKHIRVRYGETDRMGYVYYGNYALYFEEGRTEAIRQLGLSYKQLEDEGIILPVITFQVHYKNPAQYDDILKLKTTIPQMPDGVRIRFDYEMHNQDGKLICEGYTILAFIKKATNKATRVPEKLQKSLEQHFK